MTVTKINTTLRVLTIVLGIATVLAMSHVYALLMPAQALALSNVVDTVSTSAPSAADVDHTIEFDVAGTSAGLTGDGTARMIVWFDSDSYGGNASGSDLFDLSSLAVTDIEVDIDGTPMSLEAGGCTTEDLSVTITDGVADENIEFILCNTPGSDIDAGDNIDIRIGPAVGTNGIGNPNVAGTSYPVTIHLDDDAVDGDFVDSGETRVMILDQVDVSAQVETNLTCTIVDGFTNGDGVTLGTGGFLDVHQLGTGDETASPTALDFGVITPDDGVSDVAAITFPGGDAEAAGQTLDVGTNAANGFVWTIEQDQNLLSAITADFDLFIDAGVTTTPTDWTSPSNVITDPDTWGHYGITTDDDNLETDTGTGAGGVDDFDDAGGANASCADDTLCFVGNFNAARIIFANDGPADGDTLGGGTQNRGLARWAMVIEATSLQEAASDYSNTLTHICTPTF